MAEYGLVQALEGSTEVVSTAAVLFERSRELCYGRRLVLVGEDRGGVREAGSVRGDVMGGGRGRVRLTLWSLCRVTVDEGKRRGVTGGSQSSVSVSLRFPFATSVLTVLVFLVWCLLYKGRRITN